MLNRRWCMQMSWSRTWNLESQGMVPLPETRLRDQTVRTEILHIWRTNTVELSLRYAEHIQEESEFRRINSIEIGLTGTSTVERST